MTKKHMPIPQGGRINLEFLEDWADQLPTADIPKFSQLKFQE